MIITRLTRSLLIALLISSFISIASFSQEIYLVKRVVDGDTLELENNETVRLIGIDTPETVHPSKPVEYFGKEASSFTKRMVEGKGVRLEYDVQKRDKYGRLLAYVFLKDGTFLNAEIVKQGYGKASTYPPNVKYAEKFRKLQSQARENNRGLWAPHGEPSKEVVSSHAKTENDAVYITRTGKKYHRGNCRYLSKSKIPIS